MKKLLLKSLSFVAMLFLFLIAIDGNAQITIYDADFSTDGDGFPDHDNDSGTSINEPPAGPQSVGPFGTSPNSWSLSYTSTPLTDGTANSFKVISGNVLKSDDWGGQGIFKSQVIDVSSISFVNIMARSVNSGANNNKFKYFYILDGGSRVESSIGATTDGDPVNYNIEALDVSSSSNLIVGFEFDENGSGEGYETSEFKVEDAEDITRVNFTNRSVIVNEEDGTVSFDLSILNEDLTNATQVEVALTSGNAADIGNYTTQTVTFPANSSTNETFTIDITSNSTTDGDKNLTFSLQNVTGGNNAQVGVQNTFDLTILDNEVNRPEITSTNTPLLINFDDNLTGVNNATFNGTGFTPTPSPGQLNSNAWAVTGLSDGNLAFGESQTSNDFARGTNTGGVTEGGVYAFQTSTTSTNNYSLGVQPTANDFTPGTLTLRVQNKTGGEINELNLGYKFYYLNNENRGSPLSFSYSEDNRDYTEEYSSSTPTTASANNPVEWVGMNRSSSITGLSIPDGDFLYLRWTIGGDSNGTGARDEVALDDISISFNRAYIYDAGSWSPNNPVAGTPLSTTADDIEVRSGTAIISGELLGNNLIISTGATLEMAAPASSTDNPTILNLAGDINNDGSINFKSNEFGTAEFGEFTGSISGVSGNISVERYIPAKRAFRLLSSAVGGQSIANAWQQNTHITGAVGTVGQTSTDGFDETASGAPSMFTFDNSVDPQTDGSTGNASPWTAIGSTSEVISAGTPYRLYVRGDRTIDLSTNEAPATETTLIATGTMLTGSLTTGSELPALASVEDNFSFVGNPYQAVVDINATTRTNLTDFIYVWDTSIDGDNGNGGYVTVELPSGSNGTPTAPDPNSSDASEYIAPGQAFFVQNTGVGDGSITFEEADKATNEPQVTVFSTYSHFYINSRLYPTANLQNAEMESDAIGLRFSNDYTTLGSNEDATKLVNPGENYAIVNNGFRAIDKQSLPADGHNVQLLIVNYNVSNYSLTFNLGNTPETLKVYLNDAYLNTQIELSEKTRYDFTVDTNISESVSGDRFSLSFEQVTLSNQSFEVAYVRLYPNPVENQLQVKLPTSIEVNEIKIYSMLGQEVTNSQSTTIEMPNLKSGIYLVEILTKQGKFTKKIIKK